MFNVQQITSRLAGMSDSQLQQYAAMHKDDPYILPLAKSEFDRRQQIRTSGQGQQPQQTVADEALQEMSPQTRRQMAMLQAAQAQQGQQAPQEALPEQQGIGPLPAQNIQGMADGGIAGYAEGKTVKERPELYGDEMPQFDPELQRRLDIAKREYKRLYGKELPTTSGIRTRKKQEQLHKDWAAGKSGVFIPADPAAYPGRKWFHTEAVDISAEVPEAFLKKYGIIRPLGKRDPVHAVAMKNWKPTGDVAKMYESALTKTAAAVAGIPSATAGEVVPAQRGQQKEPAPPAQAQRDTKTKGSSRVADAAALDKGEEMVTPPSTATAPTGGAKKDDSFLGKAKNRAGQIAESFTKYGPFGGMSALIGGDAYGRLNEPRVERIPEESDSMFQLRQIDDPNAVRRGEQYRQVPSAMAQFEELIRGTPEAALSIGTGALSPWTATAPAVYHRLTTGKDMPTAEALNAVTFAPRSEAGKAALEQYGPALEAMKLPPYMPVPQAGPGMRDIYRTLTGKDKPLMTKAELARREKRASSAQAAQDRANAPAQGELPGVAKPTQAEIARAAELERQRAAEQQVQQQVSPQPTGKQLDLFTPEETPPSTIVGEYSPYNEQVRNAALKQKIRDEFRRQADEASGAARDVRLGDLARETRKAREAYTGAEKQYGRQQAEAGARESIMFDNTARQNAATGAGLAALGAGRAAEATAAAEREEPAYVPNAEGVPRTGAYEPWEENFVPSEAGRPTPPEALAAAKPSAEEAAAATGKKKRSFDDEDLLTFGLQMMMAPAGQDGSGISKFLSNVGRSGIATLQAKTEREKEEREVLKQQAQEAYVKAMTKQLGQDPEAIRTMRAMRGDKGLYKMWQEQEWIKDLPTFRASIIKDYNEYFKKATDAGETNIVSFDQYIKPVEALFYPNPPANATVTQMPNP